MPCIVNEHECCDGVVADNESLNVGYERADHEQECAVSKRKALRR